MIQAYDSLMCDEELAEKVSAIIYKRADFIIKTIQAAKDQNLIGAHMDPVLLENILTGGSKEICLKWRMERYCFSIKEKTAEMVDTIISGFIENKI